MKANCSNCKRPIRFVESMIGERTICPHCRHETELPADFREIELEDDDWRHHGVPVATEARPTRTANSPVGPSVSERTRSTTIDYGPGGFSCPYCHSRMLPFETKRISTAGWVTFVVLLIVFFPLFWIGFLMTEPVRKCSGCGHEVG